MYRKFVPKVVIVSGRQITVTVMFYNNISAVFIKIFPLYNIYLVLILILHVHVFTPYFVRPGKYVKIHILNGMFADKVFIVDIYILLL